MRYANDLWKKVEVFREELDEFDFNISQEVGISFKLDSDAIGRVHRLWRLRASGWITQEFLEFQDEISKMDREEAIKTKIRILHLNSIALSELSEILYQEINEDELRVYFNFENEIANKNDVLKCKKELYILTFCTSTFWIYLKLMDKNFNSAQYVVINQRTKESIQNISKICNEIQDRKITIGEVFKRLIFGGSNSGQ